MSRLLAFLALAVLARAAGPQFVPVAPGNTARNGPPIPATPAAESAHPAAIPLWPNGAPGSEARKDEPEQISWRQEPDIVFPIIFNIHSPSLTPFLPAKDKATGCAVIIAPGGGHMFHTIDREGYDVAKWFAERGIAAFVLKYRLARDAANTAAGKPQVYRTDTEPRADGLRAVRLLRSRAAEFNLNPDHIGTLGFSAGGVSALAPAIASDAGKPDDADPIERQSSRAAFHAMIYAELPRGDYEVPKGTPPAFLLAAYDDSPKAAPLATYLLKLKTAGVPAELHIYTSGGHGFGVRSDRPNLPISRWPERFQEWLGDIGMLKKIIEAARKKIIGLGTLWLAAVAAAQPAPPAKSTTYEKDVVPLLTKYCYECHGDGAHKAGLALDDYATAADVRAGAKKWDIVLRHVARHEMPPEDAEAFPTGPEREVIAQFIERELYQLDPAHPDPGRVTLRRLNRAEYSNAIRDLTGIAFNAAADFPPDDSGYGFDNIGDVLSLPPVLMEKYLAAADKVLDQAIVTEPIQSRTLRVPSSLAIVGFNAIGDRGDGWVHLISLEEDDVDVQLPIVAGGDYLVRFHAFTTKDGGAVVGQGSEKPLDFAEDPGPTRIALALNDVFITDFVVTRDEKNPGVYEARVGVPAGRQSFRAVMRRKRYGENELTMLNGRLGKQQPGIGFVKWLEIEGPLHSATRRTAGDKLAATGPGRNLPDGARWLSGNGEVSTEIEAGRDGEFILRAQAFAQQAGTEPTRMEFRIDGKPLKTFDVLAPATMQPIPRQRVFTLALLVPQPEIYETRTQLSPGKHTFSAAFVNDFTDPENTNPNLRDRNLIIQNLEVADLSAPALIPPIPEPLQELFARHHLVGPALAAGPSHNARDNRDGLPTSGSPTMEKAAARGIIGDFARRAWRRPVTAAELDRLERLYTLARQQSDPFEVGVKLALKAVLVSPHFLFLNEGFPAGSSRDNEAGAAPQSADRLAPSSATKVIPLDDYALAARLAFFLWSSVPDDELLRLAGRGELRRNLASQVKRMLGASKSQALVDNFAGQWLQIRSLETFAPDKTLFPDFDPNLRNAMQRETELFFEHVLREDRNVFDFLRGDYTFVNARLAKFYGLPEVRGEEFQKVSLAGTPRRGVLTHASVLTLTSNPTRTSPVKRGKWVLDNLLGTPPPPPPPNIPELDDKERKLTGTLRQQMAQHRTNPTCASCHVKMDAIGFGLENFNAIGAWRDKDGDAPVDASGEFAGGDAFAGASELANLLATKRADDFRRCLAEKMLTYALGRGVEYYDRPAVEQIMASLKQGDDKFSALMLAVAQSFPFQNRRAESVATVSSN